MTQEEKQIMITKCKESFLFFALGCYPFDWLTSSSLYVDLDSNDNLIIEKSRQVGMSSALALYIIWFATFHDNKRILFVSPNHGMSSNFRKRLDNCLKAISFFNMPRAVSTYKNTRLTAINTTTISYKSKGDFPICSELFDLVILDEADFFDDLEDVWRCVLPCCANKDTKIIIDSTLSGKDSFFVKMINSAQSKTGAFSSFTFTKILSDIQ